MSEFWVFYEQGPAVKFEADDAAYAAERYANRYQIHGTIHVAADTQQFRTDTTVSEIEA